MIVTINDKNRKDYDALFVDSYKYLIDKGFIQVQEGDTKSSLSGLPEYYSHMNDFFTTEGWKYVFLPIDEEVFRIDLKDRSIKVPSSFAKQVSIQSDKLAETIVFSVDRYFDYMDLANTNIYVQWKTPNGKEQATRIRMIDLSQPDMIRFGWPISDIVTKDPGTIKFSVRFFRIAPGEDGAQDLVYSLNTAESSFNITAAHQATLNDISEVEEQEPDLFKHVVLNSNYYLEGVTPPAQPDFLGDVNIYKMVNGVLTPVSAANLEDDTLTLYAEAITADNGVLSYEWYCGDTNCKDENVKYAVAFEMVAFNAPLDKDGEIDWNAAYIPGQRYFKLKEGQEFNASDLTVFERVSKVVESKEDVLYRLFSTLTILKTPQGIAPQPVVGTYHVEAYNTIAQHTTLLPEISSVCNLPTPAAVTLKTDLSADKNFIEVATDAEGKEVVSKACVLSIEVESVENSIDTLSYSWKYSKTGEEDSFADISGSSNTINARERGWYMANVQASANRSESEKVPSQIAKVTAEPIAPQFLKDDDYEALVMDLNNLEEGESLTVTFPMAENIIVDDPLYSEKITYQWYVNGQDSTDDQKLVEGQESNTLTITNKTEPGYYHCVATNHLNGAQKSANSHEVGMVVTLYKNN